MAKTTPGPWWIAQPGWPVGKSDIAECGLPHAPLTVCANHDVHSDARAANAHLIAAAPELKTFAESICIYTVEGDEGWRCLTFAGVTIARVEECSAEALALLQLEAHRQTALAKAQGTSVSDTEEIAS